MGGVGLQTAFSFGQQRVLKVFTVEVTVTLYIPGATPYPAAVYPAQSLALNQLAGLRF